MSTTSLSAALAAAELTEQDRIIEEALINFATRNMKRVMHVLKCKPYVQESTISQESGSLYASLHGR
jgi:hypothetical protein